MATMKSLLSASLPSRTAGAGFPYVCMYPTMHFGPAGPMLRANVTGLASATHHNAQHSTSHINLIMYKVDMTCPLHEENRYS